MGWGNAIRYVKNMVCPDTSVYSGLPFNGKVGGIVDFQLSPFIKSSAQGGLIKTPQNTNNLIIEAISKVELGLSGQVYRYYLSKGDTFDTAEIFIQIYCLNGKPEEALYCHGISRVYPQSKEECNMFLGTHGHGLGEYGFTLWKDQILETGLYSEEECSNIFINDEKIVYHRLGASNTKFCKPIKGTETRIDDSKGSSGLSQEIYYVEYGRNLISVEERLMINTEVLKSKDHKDTEEIHVDFMIAIPLELERLKIN